MTARPPSEDRTRTPMTSAADGARTAAAERTRTPMTSIADGARTVAAERVFQSRAATIAARQADREARRTMWLSHHWPTHYAERCVRVGRHHVCRRCAALYPVGFVVAVLSALGLPPWPPSLDPAMIWLLCLPATIAFVGEAIGLFPYSARWQVAAMVVTAVGFGRALGYELVDRWSPEFWQPLAIFAGLWFLASVFDAKTTRRLPA